MGLYSFLLGRQNITMSAFSDVFSAILSPNKGPFWCTCLDTIQLLLTMAVKGDNEML